MTPDEPLIQLYSDHFRAGPTRFSQGEARA